MFSYQNKVVGIKITGQVNSDLFDLLVNNAYVGSTTDSTQGDGAYLIASNDNVYTFAGNEDYNALYYYGENKPIYYFSDLLLNEGSNQLSFINKVNNAIGNRLRYEVNSYELSGSYLTSPSSIQTGEISPTTGSDASVFFNLAFPTAGSISLVETFPVFNIDTGNLNQVFTGSGVHLQKDVTLFFDILDQQLNTVSSNQQFLENPLISGCVFDVLNADGTTAAANFSTGKFARSVTISALDNEDIFGSYQKDFGVRCKLPNTFDGSIFTGEFYVFGNLPNILDIVPDYTEFSGAAQVTELINTAIVLQNDLNFTQMNRYDVYALTGSGSAVNELTYLSPFAQEGYLFSQSAANVVNARSLTINRGALPQDVPHYFTVVPYGTLGSGSAFSFGPATFVSVQSVIELDTKVYTTGDQTISGVKTFATGIFAPNLVFNTGAQTISGLKTFSNGIVSSVGITGTNLVFNTGDQTISGVKTFANNIFAPTASFGTDTTQIATTAFVDNAVTSDQIMSTIGSNLITSLKVTRSNEQNAGIYYFATYNNLSGTFTVKTSSGRARVVNPTGGLDSQVGNGVAANNITGTLSSTSTNGLPRAFAVISVASGGSTRSGNINEISMTNKFVTNFDGQGLSSLTSLNLQSNYLTSFSGAGLSSLTSLILYDNSLTSFSASGMPLSVTSIDLRYNSLTSFSAAGGPTEISTLNLSNNSLTGVNMANVVVGGFYGYPTYYGLGLNVSNNNLDYAALNAMYTSLGTGTDGVINVNGNPGAPGDTSIANAKGYTVLGFPPP